MYMNTSDLTVSYNAGSLEISGIPPSFGVGFVLICFLSSLTAANTSYELGNIETFLCNDSYYPQSSVGIRYSSVHPDTYIQTESNCVRAPQLGSFYFEDVDESAGPPWVAFINNLGIVRGPKSGVVANYTAQKYSYDYVSRLMSTLKAEYDAKRVNPGTVEAMIPDILMHKTECIDEEIVISENRTIYDNLGPDPRNPSDPTRNKGLFPKCSSKGCFDDQFESKFNHQTYKLHDRMFRLNLLFQLADNVLSKYIC